MREDQADFAGRILLDVGTDPAKGEALYSLIGPFFHLIRNRLNSLQMSLYLARRKGPGAGLPDGDALELPYREAESLVDQFQSLCKPLSFRPMPLPLGLVLTDLGRAWTPRFAARGAVFAVGVDPRAEVGPIDPSRWAAGLEGLARWRCDRAKTSTRITVRYGAAEGRSFLTWIEQDEDVVEDRLGDSADRRGQLPLANLARVVAAHGGRLTQDHRGGWTVMAEWPTSLGESPGANVMPARGVP